MSKVTDWTEAYESCVFVLLSIPTIPFLDIRILVKQCSQSISVVIMTGLCRIGNITEMCLYSLCTHCTKGSMCTTDTSYLKQTDLTFNIACGHASWSWLLMLCMYMYVTYIYSYTYILAKPMLITHQPTPVSRKWGWL